MYNNNNTNNNYGVGFFGLLTIMFIGLKLTNFIDWPWHWILAPLWLPLAIIIVITTICYLLTRAGRR